MYDLFRKRKSGNTTLASFAFRRKPRLLPGSVGQQSQGLSPCTLYCLESSPLPTPNHWAPAILKLLLRFIKLIQYIAGGCSLPVFRLVLGPFICLFLFLLSNCSFFIFKFRVSFLLLRCSLHFYIPKMKKLLKIFFYLPKYSKMTWVQFLSAFVSLHFNSRRLLN